MPKKRQKPAGQQIFEEATENLSDWVCEQAKETYKSPLLPFEAFQERTKLQVKSSMEQLLQNNEDGYQVVLQFLWDNNDPQGKAIAQEIKKGVEISQSIDSIQKLEEQIASGKSLQDLLGYSEDTIVKFYEVGRKLFEKQDFPSAINVFSLLAMFNPFYENVWLCLAISWHTNQEWEKAIQAYAMAKELNPENPIPYYHAGQCYTRLGQKEPANKCFEEGELWAGRKPEYSKLRKEMADQRKTLSK